MPVLPKIVNPLKQAQFMRSINYHSRLTKLTSYLQDHPHEFITLAKAASIACMERTAFSRFFKRSVGITFSAFLRRWRVALAAEQMLSRDHSLAYIASSVGFKNLNSFGRTFRSVTGITPSEYKRRGLRVGRITPTARAGPAGPHMSIHN